VTGTQEEGSLFAILRTRLEESHGLPCHKVCAGIKLGLCGLTTGPRLSGLDSSWSL
jgi:hypothetical protein